MNNYNQLKEVLNEIFELNKADLDFGIYRIINQKRKQVNEFIEKQLPEDIRQALSETQSADKTEIENELKTLKKNLDDAGIVAEESPKYNTLKERLAGLENSEVLEQEVFSHLANFFKRYYKDGDFISMRRYKKDVYAIPYEGEEVKLHWANHDQYYIKSSENFKNYSFKTPDGKTVTFQLKEVSIEQNNNKTQGDVERKFGIFTDQPFEVINGNLYLNFIYEPFSKTTKQETLLSDAIELLLEQVPSEYSEVFTLSPTEKNSKRTLLEKHLNDYISKNSFDYFIHKDLCGFLSRELDYYIKNEVLYIDDINTKQGDFFVAQLGKVKAIKLVALKVIEFLSQIENFQKKLWLKKKFVIRTDYCITIDKIPTLYYPEILANKDQLKEWKSLFDVDIKTEEQFVFEQYLVLDTKFFDQNFKDRLLSEFEDLDNQTNGLLINSENFQALNILHHKYYKSIVTTYIDPPYNTNASELIYKNEFKHSTWLTFIDNRLELNEAIAADNAICCITIDHVELHNLRLIVNNRFQSENVLGTITIKNNPSGRSTVKGVSISNEYALIIGLSESSKVGNLPRSSEQEAQYPEFDELGAYQWRSFLRSGGANDFRSERPKLHYPLFISKNSIRIPEIEWDENRREWILCEVPLPDEKSFYPISNETEYTWRLGVDSLRKRLTDLRVRDSRAGKVMIEIKFRSGDEGVLPKTIWDDKKYNATSYGTTLLRNIFGSAQLFSFPKSVYAVEDCLRISNLESNGIVIDYFGGSGTTGHATIRLNREDNGKRKFILIEMGAYFNTVTKPRIQKVIYSDNWKDGKPQDKGGVSQIIKYQLLESYEDTLNNLYLKSNIELNFEGKAKQEYILQYMLELESREHLFNLEMFRKPFDYQLKITENNELKLTKVDLVETFNYLIGLYVSKIQRVKDIKVVEGTTRTGIKTLVIWRDLETTTHDELEKLLRRFYDSQRTREFQQIYINGDHHLENLRTEGDSFKIKGIEETFFKKMFNETEL